MPLDARRAGVGGDAGRIDSGGFSTGNNGVGAPDWAGRPPGGAQRSGQDFFNPASRGAQRQGSSGFAYPGMADDLDSAPKQKQKAAARPRRQLPQTLAMVMLSTVATSPLAIIAGGVTTIVGATQVVGFALVYALVAFAMLAFSLASSAVVGHTGVAAGLHTYVARGLGERLGLGVGTLATVAYNAYTIAFYGIIGYEVSTQISDASGHAVPWGVVVVPFVALMAFLGTRTLRTSAIVVGVIFVLIIIAHFMFDFTAFSHPATGHLSTEALDPATLFTGAVGAAVGFSITAYPGVESSMALGGDLKASSRQVTRAIYISVVLVGVLNVLAAWLVTVAIGPDNVATMGGDQGSVPVFDYLTAHLGDGPTGLFGALNLAGAIGAILVFHHTATRYMRSMAKAGVLPASLAKRNKKGVPIRASLVQSALTVIVLLAIGVAGANPLWGVFMVLSHIGAVGLILALVICSVAVMIFLLKSDSEEGGFMGWEGRLVAAIVAALTLTIVLVSALLEAHVRLNVAPGSPLIYVPPAVVAFGLLVGLVWPASRRSSRSLALDEEDDHDDLPEMPMPAQRSAPDWATANSSTAKSYDY